MLVPNWTLLDCEILPGAVAIGPEWQILTHRSLVPSGHNVPELQIAALRQWPEARTATVRDGEGLRLALSLVQRNFPVPIVENWSSPVSFYGMAHIDRDLAGPALACLLRKLDVPLMLHSVPVNGALWETVAAESGRLVVLDTWQRAVLRPGGTYAQWFETSFDRKRRKEYRRLQARLAERGSLEVTCFEAGDDTLAWVDQFLTLEAAGWKGRRGTAMNADSRTATAFRDAVRDLAAAGRLRFWKLALDGKPIAMMFAIVDGSEAWLGKIAHDETLAKYSPGVLLILQATERIFAEGLTQVDSCAIPDHPMINHLWRDRLQVADVMIATHDVSAITFKAAVAAERLRRRLRAAAKTMFHRLTGKHRP
jgi:CelD/BcsL family acetyltransferase involved in cellulose biosynthesis